MANYSCSEIMGNWRFSKDVINKMSKITDKTKIIERGGVLCGSIEGIRKKKPIIDIISECEGTKCSIQLDSMKECMERKSVPKGTFHTHPGIVEALPSAGDLGFISARADILCIGTPKAKEDRIICFKSKRLSSEEEINRRKKIDYTFRLESKIITSSYTTKKEGEEYDNSLKDLFSEKYYYKFDPSKCVE